MSQAITRSCGAARRALLIAAMAPLIGSRGAPEKPVPSNASTTPAAASSAAGSAGASSAPTSTTITSRRSCRRTRAATWPSPPLFPRPQTITIGPSGTRSAHTRASALPARSISVSLGMRWRSIAHVSSARCCAASGSGVSQAGRSISSASLDCHRHGRGRVYLPAWRQFLEQQVIAPGAVDEQEAPGQADPLKAVTDEGLLRGEVGRLNSSLQPVQSQLLKR